MADKIQLPNGAFFPVKEGESKEQALAVAKQMYPDAFGAPAAAGPKQDTSGFKAALSAGATRLGGEFELLKGKAGLKSEAEAQKEYEAAQAKAAARFTPTEKGFTEAPLLKFQELLGGSLPYMAAPAAAGLTALAAPVSVPVAAGLGLLGAGAVSTGQFTGSNLARQVEAGKTLEEASLGKAAAAAVPQALIDTDAMALLPGVGKLFGSVGSKLTTEQAKAIASQTLAKTAADYTAKTGMAMGREGLTEVAQQSLERLQAGLAITDPEARKEYIDSFIGGAVLGGTLAPVGRAFERSGAKTQAARAERDERNAAAKEAAEQTRIVEEQEEARKNTPEYALQVGQQYDALLQEFKTKQAALKKPGKDATPVQKAEYVDAQKEVQALNAQLKTLVPEYRRTERNRVQAQEQARVAGMDPFDYMLEQSGQVPAYTPSAPGSLPEVDMSGIPGAASDQPTATQEREQEVGAYVADRVKLAQEQLINPTGMELADYLMQDPVKAAVVVETKTPLPGLTGSESRLIRNEVAKKLKTIEQEAQQQREAMAAQGTAAGQQRIAGVEEEEQTALEAQRMEEQRAAQDAQLAPGIGSEIMALRRIAANPTGDVRDEAMLSTKVDRLVDLLLAGGPAPAGRVVAGTANTAASNADVLRAQLAYANATANKQRASELKKQLADLDEPDTDRAAGDLEFGEAAKEAGVEGRLSKDAMQANRVTRLSNTQLSAYDRLADFVQRVREGNQDVSDARKQTLLNAAEKLKDTVAGLALNEIDARRAQSGLPEFGSSEKTKLVGQIAQTLNELIERGAGIFQKPVERKAQMRGTQIVMGAGEAEQQPLGRRVFNNYEAAASALREQMRSDIDSLGGFAPAEVAAPRPERKAQRVVPLLKPQRPGLSDRSTEQQFGDALRRAVSDADRALLAELQTKFKNLSPLAQEDALDQVRNVELRRPAQAEGRLKEELADLRAAGVSDTGQEELFTGESEKASTRTTPQRFRAFLDSKKIQGLRAKLAEENRVLAFQEKRAATIAKKAADEAAKTEAAEQKILASNARTPAQKARDALDRLVGPESKVTQALQISNEIKKQRETSRTRLRGMLSQIEDAELRAKKQVADIQELLAFTNKKLAEVTATNEFGVAPSMNDLAVWTQARDNQTTELKKAQKTLDAVQKSLNAAQATQARVIEDHAKDTMGNALINEGNKAQRKYDAAKTVLEKAEAEEKAALRILNAEQTKRAAPQQTVDEQVAERLGPNARVVGTERVYRDTSDANVQAQINAERKNIAAAEVAHDAAKAAGDKLAMENTLRRIETAYAKMYNILNNAPVRREKQMTDAEAKNQETFDRAQAKAFEANIKLFEEAAGIRPLKMTERRTIASVRNVKAGRIETQIKQESVAAQETRVKKEEETGVYPARALENLAKARAERADAQRQIDYIDANPAAPRSDAKKRQTDARAAAVAKRKDLDARIKELVAAQREVVAEARLDKQAEKALRKEKNAMVRSAGRLQEAVGEDAPDMDALYRVSKTTGPSMSVAQVQKAYDALTGKWVNKPQTIVVADKTGLPARIRSQAERDNMTGKIPGLYDPQSKKVYLVASNLRSVNDVILTTVHEIAGHFGLQSILGDTYAKTMTDIYNGNAAIRKAANAKMKQIKSLDQNTAVEEALAEQAELDPNAPDTRSAMRRIYDTVKKWMRDTLGFKDTVTDAQVNQIIANARHYVIEGGTAGTGTAGVATPSYRSKAAAPANALESLAQEITAQPKTLKEKMGNNLALQAEMQAVDMRAGLRDTLKFGDDSLFTQAMYHVRKAEQKMAQMFTVMNSGPLVAYKDEKGLVGYRSSNQNSAREVFDAIADIPVDDPQMKTNIAQAYMVAQRAQNKGLSKLDLGELGVTEEKLKAALAAADADPALKNALENVRRKYNAYNKGMIEFLASTGRISKKTAADLLKDGDYVPYYRVRDNGMAELNFGNNVTFNVGDIRRQPYLAELKGGETKLLPLNEAIQQNTLLLTDMALTNNAAKSVAYGLQALGKGMGPVDPNTGKPTNLMAIKSGFGPDDAKVVRFYQEPDPSKPDDDGKRHIVVDTKGTLAEGIPAELVVQSLEGASLALPGFLKLGGVAADLLRAGVTRTPLYIARKLVREPMAAAFTGGLNTNAFSSVFKAGAEFLRMSTGSSDAQAKLIEKGLIQSNIFAGDMSDMKKMALQLASGKDQGALDKVFAAADRYAMRADAATLALVLKNAEANGLSEVEADMMTMESMNFYKRGLSPPLQFASRLIPFFNSQIQGLNVLAKAARGNMPFEEQQPRAVHPSTHAQCARSGLATR